VDDCLKKIIQTGGDLLQLQIYTVLGDFGQVGIVRWIAGSFPTTFYIFPL